jgi:hypothetical protein
MARSDRRVVENAEYQKMVARMVKAMARRAGGDIDALPALQELSGLVDDLMVEAVAQCRSEGYSWAEVGKRLGTTRQAAQQRYGRKSEEQAS